MMRELVERAECEAYERGLALGLKQGRAQERRLHAHKDPANHEQARRVAWAGSGKPLNLVDGIPAGWPEGVDPDKFAHDFIETAVLHDAAPAEPEPTHPNVERLRAMIGGGEP